MKYRFVISLIALGIVGLLYSPAVATNQIEEGAIGIALFDVDATPPIGSQLTYDPMNNSDNLTLRARGVVLLGDDLPIVLCSIDWIGISNESQDMFKAAMAEAAGTIPNRVALHTVHQHDAPICDFSAEKMLIKKGIDPYCFDGTFARELISRLQESISSSLQNIQQVTAIGLGSADVEKVASNRRVYKENGRIVKMRGSSCNDEHLRSLPEGLIDPEVSLISFWNGEKPLAVLSFYACHPQSYYLTKIANPDFPGIARYMRELAVPDALHIHFNGAGGNIAAGKYNDGSKETRLTLALRLADGMRRAWESSKKIDVTASDLRWNTENLLLPPNEKVKEIESAMAGANSRFLANNMGRLGWYKRRIEGKGIETGCLSLQDARILFMPGELFVEYQLAAKEMAPNNFVAMAAYGDYGPFYIGTEEAYREGGYEIESSPVTAESESIIMTNIERLLAKSGDYICDDLLTYRDKKGEVRPVTNNNEWAIKRKEIISSMEEVMGKLPKREGGRIKVNYIDTTKYNEYVRYHISFEVAPSERLFADIYRPNGEQKKFPAIVAMHGTSAHGKRVLDGRVDNRAFAKELAERGYVVIAPDYPSFGELSDHDFSTDRYQSGTMRGIFNHISSVDLLQSLPYVDRNRIGAFGHSLGGHNALFLGVFDERIKVVVTSCGWTLFDYYDSGSRVTELYGGRLGPWAQDRYMPLIRDKYQLNADKIPFDFDEVMAAIAPRPLFSNSPIYDMNFAVDGVRKGAAQVEKVYRFMDAENNFQVVYPLSEHTFSPDAKEAAFSFLKKHL